MSDHTNFRIEFVGQGWGISAKQRINVHGIEQVLHSNDANEVTTVLDTVHDLTQQGKYAFGFIAYEAAMAFGLPVRNPDSNLPLIWFAIVETRDVSISNHSHYKFTPHIIDTINLSVCETEYQKHIGTIKQQIENGNTYQTNYTIRAHSDFAGDAQQLFYQLNQNQPVPYAALIETDDCTVISLSPELFLKREGDFLQSKPMKGTHQRGRFVDEDNKFIEDLKSSEKERAENIMIVDMMRNDMGRISRFGSVQVYDQFHVQSLRTVLQMTSTVNAELTDEVSLTDIMRATFPAASVTGAPKHKTMGIISELESTPRGVYCGAVGMIKPGGDFVFNVAIRTLMKDKKNLLCGVGSGVVWDSEAQKEYQEIHTKTLFLRSRYQSFQLIETILLNEQLELVYLEEHLVRLKRSADYFGYFYDEAKIRAELNQYSKTMDSPCAVRMLLSEDGSVKFSNRDISPVFDHPKIVISDQRVDSSDPFYFHKTTNRGLYNSEREKANGNGVFEVVFLNEKGYITEGSITNIFMYKNQQWITPPIEDGILNGVWRQKFLSGSDGIEKHLTVDDLRDAEKIVVGNSVMGVVEVALIESSS